MPSNRAPSSRRGKSRLITRKDPRAHTIQKRPPPKRYHTKPNGSGARSRARKTRFALEKPKIVTGVRFPFDASSSRLGKYRANEIADARKPRTTDAKALSRSPAPPNATVAPTAMKGPNARNAQR